LPLSDRQSRSTTDPIAETVQNFAHRFLQLRPRRAGYGFIERTAGPGQDLQEQATFSLMVSWRVVALSPPFKSGCRALVVACPSAEIVALPLAPQEAHPHGAA
jgi:hypothetical protein